MRRSYAAKDSVATLVARSSVVVAISCFPSSLPNIFFIFRQELALPSLCRAQALLSDNEQKHRERIRTLEEFCRKHLTTLSSLSQIVATTRQELEIVQHRNDQLQRQLNAVECLSKNLDEVKQRLDALEKHGMRVDMRLSEAHSQLDERVTRSLQQQAPQIEMLTDKLNAIQTKSQQDSLPASQRTASSLLPGHNRIDNAGIGHFTTQGKRQNSPTSETSIEHERSQRFKQSHGQATAAIERHSHREVTAEMAACRKLHETFTMWSLSPNLSLLLSTEVLLLPPSSNHTRCKDWMAGPTRKTSSSV